MLRVCWDGGRPRVVKRALPAAAAARRRWAGVASAAARPGPARPRAASAPAFTCAGGRCEQRHPRMPDDGEWQCTDSAGATICMGGERAAGVAAAAAPETPAGSAARAAGAEPGARLCVDLSPDFPDGRAPGWRCRTLYDGPPRRICERDPDAHTLARKLRRATPVRRRQPLRGRLVRPGAARAAPAGCKRTVRAAVAASAAASRGACETDGHRARGRAGRCGRAGGGGGVARPAGGTSRRAADCLRLDGPQAPVGFDATFSITATLACPDLRGRPHRLGAGRAVRRVVGLIAGARRVRADRAHAVAGRRRWAVRSRGASSRCRRARAARSCCARPGPTAAATRSRATRASPPPTARAACPTRRSACRVHLGGQGWHVTARPANSNAALATAGGVASLLPDVAGDWRLADGGGRTLALRTARYDETPLDCGRSGCHAEITDAAAASPMTTVLARLHRRQRRAAIGLPRAAPLACHATGEPGAADGGFAHVAAELGAAGDLGRRWHELPRDLHRLGGVGCLACHGPGAIPESAARWSVLRADVCAVCHDAPPRYGHVAGLAADRDGARRSATRARAASARARAATPPGDSSTPSRRRSDSPSIGARPTTSGPSASAAPPATPCTTRKRPGAPAPAARHADAGPADGGGRGPRQRLPPLPHARRRRRAAARLGGRPLARARRAGSGDRRGR